MCFFRLKCIFTIFIIPIYWNILNGKIVASSDSANLDNKNFAEGGLIISYNSTEKTINNSFNLEKKNSVESHLNKLNLTLTSKNLETKAHNNDSALNNKSITLTKLVDGGTNLFLGAPEVFHINGTSSIKPRKGVYYNKIVPRKGVDLEYEFHHNVVNKSCLLLRENECYITPLNLQEIVGYCCNESNFDNNKYQMTGINCSSCTLTNILSNSSCEHFCVKNKTNVNTNIKTQIKIKNQDSFFKNADVIKDIVKSITSEKTIINNKSLKDSSASSEIKYTDIVKKKKLKPKITKVPNDVEFVDDLFSRSKRDVLMPILVSIFLLPLIGILVFFIWRRAKEYWSKRYYKRMDFLIDGMYNDQYS